MAGSSRRAQLKLARPLTPHDLQAKFITLALEGKAPLHLVQYAAGHKDPRKTEHYQRRKEQLDENAVDNKSTASGRDLTEGMIQRRAACWLPATCTTTAQSGHHRKGEAAMQENDCP